MRAVCIRTHLRDHAPDVRLYACGVRRPGHGTAPLWTRDVPSLADVVAAMDDLRLHRDEATGWRRREQRLILVCTNGRHDQCCANRGRPLVRALRETRWADQLWECSHIGGDRFAANVVVLPDSIYFGRVEPESAVPLLERLENQWQVEGLGSTALKLARIAAGRGDGFVSRGPKSEWDVCAGTLILELAGGRTTDTRGRSFRFNRRRTERRGVVAASMRYHPALLAAVSTVAR